MHHNIYYRVLWWFSKRIFKGFLQGLNEGSIELCLRVDRGERLVEHGAGGRSVKVISQKLVSHN